MVSNLHFHLSIDIEVRNEIQGQFIRNWLVEINILNGQVQKKKKNVFSVYSELNNLSARFLKTLLWIIMYFQRNFISGII